MTGMPGGGSADPHKDGAWAALADQAALLRELYDQAVRRDFTGSLPYLTALIGAMQAATAVVLTAYFGKSRAENTRGGIVYDAALGQEEIDA